MKKYESFINEYGMWPFNILSKKWVNRINKKIESLSDEEKIEISDKILNKIVKTSIYTMSAHGILIFTSFILESIGIVDQDFTLTKSLAISYFFVTTLMLSLANGLTSYKNKLDNVCELLKDYSQNMDTSTWD